LGARPALRAAVAVLLAPACQRRRADARADGDADEAFLHPPARRAPRPAPPRLAPIPPRGHCPSRRAACRLRLLQTPPPRPALVRRAPSEPSEHPPQAG